jgi:hypothetical protein
MAKVCYPAVVATQQAWREIRCLLPESARHDVASVATGTSTRLRHFAMSASLAVFPEDTIDRAALPVIDVHQSRQCAYGWIIMGRQSW